MKRGTTPTITISINGAKVDDIGKMFITIEQGDLQLDITEYSKHRGQLGLFYINTGSDAVFC